MLQNKNIKIVFKTTLGLVLFIWMAYSLYNQINQQENLKSTLYELFYNWNEKGISYLSIVIFLMMINWMIESYKWQLLLKGTEKFTLLRAMQSVLTGVAVSLITPNRIGEYMGRILYLRNIHKIQGITVTIVGSFAQLIVTGFLGLSGLIYYIIFIRHTIWLILFLIISVMLSIVMIYFYFHLSKIIEWTQSISFLQKMKVYIEIVKRFDRKQLFRILLLSLIRYSVYTIQFVILLKLFLVQANLIDLVCSIWVIFWAMAIVPTIAIAELGIRGETALFFLLPLSINQLGIVSSTMVLWFINLIIPALIGCLFVYKIKIYGDE